MKVQNCINPISFGVKIKTESVLEVTSGVIFHNIGNAGYKEVAFALSDKPIKATGWQGYNYYGGRFAQPIRRKYPKIARAACDIIAIYANNPKMKKAELAQKIKPIVDRFGETVDIVL